MKQLMNDQLLHIKTTGNERGSSDSLHYHPYEATSYEALEKLFDAHPLKSTDRFVDFGCGKGRAAFLANYRFNATVIGVEIDELFYENAIRNRDDYLKAFIRNEEKVIFHCSLAQEYPIHPMDNKFYFFNPFSIQIFIAVLQNILKSYEKNGRDMDLILYYSSQEYFYYLEDYTPFELVDVIKLEGEGGNPFERFLIYRLNGF